MKVGAFNGNPHKKGNTSTLIKCVLEELEQEGIDTEIVQLVDKKLKGCIACYKCFEYQDQRCDVKK